ncbi:unnamed protein product, partial [Oikopleura dioica]
DVKENQKQRHP